MSADNRVEWRTYGGSIVDKQLPVVDPVLVYAKTSASRVAVQRIQFSPSVYVESTITFSDSLTGEVVGAFAVPAQRPSGIGLMTIEFGAGGAKLSAGANLLVGTTNGAAGRLYISAFQRPR